MKTSIAVTTYNGCKYIIELLNSIKNQTRMPDEVIIVDDMSTDNTVSIVKEFVEKNCLVNWNVIRNESNLGWKKNFRKAMNLCTGDIIFFCDQDDVWHKDKIDVMCNVLEQHSNVKVLVSNYVLLSEGCKQIRAQKDSDRNDGLLKWLHGNKRIGTISRPGCSYAFTKEIAELMGEFDNVNCAHDHVVYNLGLITDSLYIINRQLIDFRRHTCNASTYKMKFGKERKSLEAKERVDVCEILLKYCKKINDTQMEKFIQIRKNFYSARMEMYDKGNALKMLGFIISNIKQYWSIREIVVDLIAMVK